MLVKGEAVGVAPAGRRDQRVSHGLRHYTSQRDSVVLSPDASSRLRERRVDSGPETLMHLRKNGISAAAIFNSHKAILFSIKQP